MKFSLRAQAMIFGLGLAVNSLCPAKGAKSGFPVSSEDYDSSAGHASTAPSPSKGVIHINPENRGPAVLSLLLKTATFYFLPCTWKITRILIRRRP
jgi:hypothetical protein